MRPAGFDSVACARQIVYRYARRAPRDQRGSGAAAIDARRFAAQTFLPQWIALTQAGIVAVIAFDLWRIAAP
ncbi:MAG: hypothetical protein ABSB70_14620 [Candidatus Velthaea sp.]|jgi:hypothetical protein